MPVSACKVKLGAVACSWGIHAEAAGRLCSRTSATVITTRAAPKAAGTAHRGRTASTISHTASTGAIAPGSWASAVTGATHSGSSTPASMACATAVGMRVTRRASAGQSPVANSSAAVTANAPTAAGHPPATAPVVISSAAPGVDHALVIGIRNLHDSSIEAAPIARLTATKPDAACAGLAPAARNPASTTANEDVKPTSAHTTPAPIGTAFETSCSIRRPSVLNTERSVNGT